ncbi:hypothetical protein THAOC_29326 [Thalassiosira oceanica]|uniref:Amine oxidase domain-containing protein n=1 Tax=Thalassiosira oceanica TaxID=159749 RepID=K0RXN4_THAOC|nr:hypothetical protein THAOC_29326 [Thalassiosira oceanica]|eukprot:EJK51497.1 hypothetical protein THAOC_29326 [Thalassiosira oceanica]
MKPGKGEDARARDSSRRTSARHRASAQVSSSGGGGCYPSRKSKRLLDKGVVDTNNDAKRTRTVPKRAARRDPTTNADKKNATRSRFSSKGKPAAAAISSRRTTLSREEPTVVSSAPRQPRTIVIGGGISGLAAARELSERRHDVLVLEARKRLGGRIRTIGLMCDEEWSNSDNTDEGGSDLFKVKKWSPVDVGGAFIHGTGVSTSTAPTFHVGSHDFGTSNTGRFSRKRRSSEQLDDSKPSRTSKRRTRGSKRPPSRTEKTDANHSSAKAPRAVEGGTLNPLYVLAKQKLRLKLHAAEGAYTCLVDHRGKLISDEVDQQVSEEFNDVLDLATKCCEDGEYAWKRKSDGRSPRNVVDNAAHPIGIRDDARIDPSTRFGEIFEECRRHLKESRESGGGKLADGDEDVRENLFKWHVANLEMSSGAEMSNLGQKWNDDEPFGYGGDHSYLEGGMISLVESLAEGFLTRGIDSKSVGGDIASSFMGDQGGDVNVSGPRRGIIQCGIEVTGVKICERSEVECIRKQKRKKIPSTHAVRRSSRANRGRRATEVGESIRPKDQPVSDSRLDGEVGKSCYGHDEHTLVQVKTKCGHTFEADAVVVTLPLAVLSSAKGSQGHVSFDPPLPEAKRNAIKRLGVGSYNKCVMSFANAFWDNLPRHLASTSSSSDSWKDEETDRFDFIGHASSEHGKDILFFCVRDRPILVAIFGGSAHSKQVENMHDDEVVGECMRVLKKITSKAMEERDGSVRTRRTGLSVPDWPIDYFVSRWGLDPYAKGAFSFVPPGVSPFEEFSAMAEPVYDYRPDWDTNGGRPRRPLILFAGEATTPYHPSTMHGAFETGIREAYRLDLALEPLLCGNIRFDAAALCQPTFVSRRTPATSKDGDRRSSSKSSHQDAWHFDHDASILRGVESFGGSSSKALSLMKEKILNSKDKHSISQLRTRYKNLVRMISSPEQPTTNSDSAKWKIRKEGSWLAEQKIQGSSSEQDNARRSTRTISKKKDDVFSFY